MRSLCQLPEPAVSVSSKQLRNALRVCFSLDDKALAAHKRTKVQGGSAEDSKPTEGSRLTFNRRSRRCAILANRNGDVWIEEDPARNLVMLSDPLELCSISLNASRRNAPQGSFPAPASETKSTGLEPSRIVQNGSDAHCDTHEP